jgi:DNA-binding NarL/FixJ family response regulator
VPKLYAAATVDSARSLLKELPEKPPEQRSVPLSVLIKQLRPEIQEAMSRGNSLEEIAERFRTIDLNVSVGTLRNYIRSQRKRATGTPRRRTRPDSNASVS